MKMRKIKMGLLVAVVSTGAFVALEGCKSDPASPGFEYMPDMYRSASYKAYEVNPNFADSMEARLPVKGTIPRGGMYTNYTPYEYPNTNEGYEAAGLNLKNPITATTSILAEGKRLYEVFCVHCHGEQGDGQGWLVTSGKFAGVPSYSGQLKDLPEGKMYHTLMYGKNMMGSHASQVNMTERWTILRYVQTLQKGGAMPADTTASAAKDSTKTK
jgi:mono/diheme cytochrome c family protein